MSNSVSGAQEYSSRTAGVTIGTAVTAIVILVLLTICVASYVIQRKLEKEQQKFYWIIITYLDYLC